MILSRQFKIMSISIMDWYDIFDNNALGSCTLNSNDEKHYISSSFQQNESFNPFPPSVPIWYRLLKLSILI